MAATVTVIDRLRPEVVLAAGRVEADLAAVSAAPSAECQLAAVGVVVRAVPTRAR